MVLLQGLCYVVDITMVFLTFIGIFDSIFSYSYIYRRWIDTPSIGTRCDYDILYGNANHDRSPR